MFATRGIFSWHWLRRDGKPHGTQSAGACRSTSPTRTARSRRTGFTPEARQSLVLTLQVARELHHDRLSPGHLLLGLLRLDHEFVAEVITQSETTVAMLSAAVLAALSPA